MESAHVFQHPQLTQFYKDSLGNIFVSSLVTKKNIMNEQTIVTYYGFSITWLGSLLYKRTWSLIDFNNTNAYQTKLNTHEGKYNF